MAPFQAPDFEWTQAFYTAVGVSVFWGKWGRLGLKPYFLPSLLNVLPIKGKYREAVEFLVFLAIGCVVAVGAVEPKTVQQALAAGFAWTGAFSYPEAPQQRK